MLVSLLSKAVGMEHAETLRIVCVSCAGHVQTVHSETWL